MSLCHKNKAAIAGGLAWVTEFLASPVPIYRRASILAVRPTKCKELPE